MIRRSLLAFCLVTSVATAEEASPAAPDPFLTDEVLLEQDVQDRPATERWVMSGRHPADPWESVNRRIFIFNEAADRWVLRPAANGYRRVTPDFLQRGIGNFFSNIAEVRNILNNTLQGKFRDGATDTGRLLINTTVGVLGFFDVAGQWGLLRSNEDFGQTLGAWGLDSGPFLVVPLLGPRTVRDGFGSVVDGYTDPVFYVEDGGTRAGLVALRIVDTRAALLEAEGMISGDRYLFLRDAYLQRREFLVKDGQVRDDFGVDDEDGWPEWE